MNFGNKYDNVYIYSPSLHQDLYQKLIKCFSSYTLIHVIASDLNEEYIGIVIDEVIFIEVFEKSIIQIETYESTVELKFPRKNEDGGNVIIDDFNEKRMNDTRVQVMFKRSRHNNLAIFIISQDYYELPKRTIRANVNIYHILKPNNFRDVLNICQDKSSRDMPLNEFKYLTSTCWDKKY